MNDQTTEGAGKAPATVDLGELLALDVDTIKTRFGDMSDVDLATLRALDARGEKPRSTLDKAIAAEQAQRSDEEGARRQQMIDDAVAEAGKAQADRVAALEAEIAAVTKERDAALEKLDKATNGPKPPRQRKADRPRALKLAGKADLGEATTVAFAGDRDMTNPALPDLEFGEGDFVTRGVGKVLTRRVEFDEKGPASTISAAFLLDEDGKAVGVSRLKEPVTVGAGRKALLPARSLLFRAE